MVIEVKPEKARAIETGDPKAMLENLLLNLR
jgi:hypothetical protein